MRFAISTSWFQRSRGGVETITGAEPVVAAGRHEIEEMLNGAEQVETALAVHD
jgi:hypothetical protein